MTYSSDDLDEIDDIRAQVVISIENVTEEWKGGNDGATEIAAARQRLDKVEEISRTAHRELRIVEVRNLVRGAWKAAFAAGDVPDHEDDDEYRMLDDLITVHGITEMLVRAEEAVDPARERSPRDQILHGQDLGMVQDQLLERILHSEGASSDDMPDEDDAFFTDPRWQRTEQVLDALITAVHGPPSSAQGE